MTIEFDDMVDTEDNPARWIAAPTPCPWCRIQRTHWHSFRGWTKDGAPRLGCILSYTEPLTWGEAVEYMGELEEAP